MVLKVSLANKENGELGIAKDNRKLGDPKVVLEELIGETAACPEDAVCRPAVK